MQYPIIDLITDAYINNGWTGLDISTGKNLFSGQFRQGNYADYNPQAFITTEDRPQGSAGDSFTVTVNDLDFSIYRYVVFGAQTKNGTSSTAIPDSGWRTTNTTTITLTKPGNPYVAITFNKLDGNAMSPSDIENIEITAKIQIETGTTPTPYEPYGYATNDFPNCLKLPLPHYFPHPVIDALQRAAAGTQTADDTEILRHYLTPLGIGGI